MVPAERDFLVVRPVITASTTGSAAEILPGWRIYCVTASSSSVVQSFVVAYQLPVAELLDQL